MGESLSGQSGVKADPRGVLTGSHILSGNQACAEGALSAGCRFLGAYPIEPAIEVSQRFLERAKAVDDATFIQMEDEISALAAVIGASWTGKKAMTVTSGSGLSLMMEHLGLGVMLETPCVIVDVQSVGPGLGIANRAAQADIMQARWGSHGDYETVALAPSSPQEMYDHMIGAFNISERFRIPVMVMSDAYLAQKKEVVIIPKPETIELYARRYYDGKPGTYLPFKRDGDYVPRMVDIGHGYKFHVTGLTHDDRGYPVMNEECQEYNVHPLVWKIRKYMDELVDVQETGIDDAEYVVVSYGTSARASAAAVEQARAQGLKVGHMKLNIVWPFPEKRITEIAKHIKAFIVPEINFGQIVYEVQRSSYGKANVVFMIHGDKGMEDPSALLTAIESLQKETHVKDSIIEYQGA
ncbi:2-oxoacid:acceptor oxidoreductase subunit alpha [candidate division WOR-3 bacterium]|nr:2-oxoacid:acceptor oxidoreductase subunit alpha [candidate division WOR-3 bacterium]